MRAAQLKTPDEAFNSALKEILLQVSLEKIGDYRSRHFNIPSANRAIFKEHFRLKEHDVKSFSEAFQVQLRNKWPDQAFTFYDTKLNRADVEGIFNLWFAGKEYSMSIESTIIKSSGSYNVDVFVVEGPPYPAHTNNNNRSCSVC